MSAENSTIIIQGASGDLSRRKLVPALFNLDCMNRLPGDLRIIGSARSQHTDDSFRQVMWDSISKTPEMGQRRAQWEKFSQRLHYVQGSVDSVDDASRLRQRLESFEGDGAPANRLFYLSIAPQLYEKAISTLGESGLAAEDSGWRRVVVEKPFGWDLESARALNDVVHTVFREDQVFRIDHYLGKETVQNMLVMRFANSIFEPVWNRNYVSNVQITVSEDALVGTRGGYYDQSGVVRDMLQNHLLQLLALTAMEPPIATDSESLRNKKVEVLSAIRRYTPDEAIANAVMGQYEGYLSEEGVPDDSRTPTYSAARLFIDNWRWHDVPFYLRTGKGLKEKVTEVIIEFQLPPAVVFSMVETEKISSNVLGVCIQPDEGVHLRFEAKVPGQDRRIRSVDMEFHFESAFQSERIPDAYERLLEDALHGDTRLFLRSDQIEHAWRIVDPFLEAWENPGREAPVVGYPIGSWGPEFADGLLSKMGHHWQRVCSCHD